MRIFAAVDLRGGAAVQLVGGQPDTERVRWPDPASVARQWVDAGFGAIHVVDLDAALGTGDNGPAVAAIAEAVAGRALLQVGGGLRDDDAVARALDLGADRVILGTRAVEEPGWLEAAARSYPGAVVVAADVRGGKVLSRGWREATTLDAPDLLRRLDPLPLAGILVTDVDREGRQAGANAGLFASLVAATRHPLLAAGGITTPADLEALAAAGVAGAVLGMALYTGRILPAEALTLEET
jgi:phosphoribosylformimino-5-aminoimidazole carboxamide ribotide isomerase